MGSMLVIPIQYATTLPAADPRPGPMYTPKSLPAFIKSVTIRK